MLLQMIDHFAFRRVSSMLYETARMSRRTAQVPRPCVTLQSYPRCAVLKP